jgi:hypothetical protein
MENLSDISGYTASTLVLFTFVAKDMRLLRTIAIFSNLAFITYGMIEWLTGVTATEHRSTCGDRQGSSSHGRPNPNRRCCPCPNLERRHASS